MQWTVGNTSLCGDEVPKPVPFVRAADIVDPHVPELIEDDLFALVGRSRNVLVLSLKTTENLAACR